MIESRFPGSHVRADQLLDGRFSGISRQIDVLAENVLMGFTTTAIVDCKCYSRNVDVKDVETVIGMAADVGADIGLIVTTKGFSPAAQARAENEPNVKTHLSIVTVDELELGGGVFPIYALMHHGQAGVGVVAPSGWYITPNVAPGGGRLYDMDALAVYHAPELSYDEAWGQREFGWSHISWHPDPQSSALEEILDIQHAGCVSQDPNATLLYWEEAVDNQVFGRRPWRFRKITYARADYVDLTCFAPIGADYVFYTVLLTTHADVDHDLDRLRQVAANCIPLYALQVNRHNADEYWADLLNAPEGPFPWSGG